MDCGISQADSAPLFFSAFLDIARDSARVSLDLAYLFSLDLVERYARLYYENAIHFLDFLDTFIQFFDISYLNDCEDSAFSSHVVGFHHAGQPISQEPKR